MKTSLKYKMLLTGAAFMGLAFLFFSCEKENVNPPYNTESVPLEKKHGGNGIVNNMIVHRPGLVEDRVGNLNPNIDADDVIYNALSHMPIKDVRSVSVTYQDYMNASGTATVSCANSGTSVSLAMTGLLPNCLYSAWVQIFKAPGYDGTLNNLIGYGRLSTGNTFKASHKGSGGISATLPSGTLSIMGRVDGCLINSGLEYHIVGIYQSDNVSCGVYPCIEGHYIEQFRFIFNK